MTHHEFGISQLIMNRAFEDLPGLGRIYYIFMDVPETLYDLEVIPGMEHPWFFPVGNRGSFGSLGTLKM